MRWTNELFYILFLNSITGAIAYGFWSVLKKNMAWRKKLKYIYPMLGIVEAFFIFPILLFPQIPVQSGSTGLFCCGVPPQNCA